MQKTLQITSVCSKGCSLQDESTEYPEFKVSWIQGLLYYYIIIICYFNLRLMWIIMYYSFFWGGNRLTIVLHHICNQNEYWFQSCACHTNVKTWVQIRITLLKSRMQEWTARESPNTVQSREVGPLEFPGWSAYKNWLGPDSMKEPFSKRNLESH